MRSIFTSILLVVFCSFGGFSQTDNAAIDQRLIDVYGLQRVQELAESQPQFIRSLNYYVQNSYMVIYDVPQHKRDLMPDISELHNTRTGESIQESDIDSLNILLLDIHLKPDEYRSYKVGSSNMVVIFKSQEHITLDFNQSEKLRK